MTLKKVRKAELEEIVRLVLGRRIVAVEYFDQGPCFVLDDGARLFVGTFDIALAVAPLVPISDISGD